MLQERLQFRPAIDQIYARPTVAALAAEYLRQCNASPPSGTALPNHGIDAVQPAAWAFGPLLNDPQERAAFVAAQHGVRRDLATRPAVALGGGELRAPLAEQFSRRRSYRRFSHQAIPSAAFGGLLACLRQLCLDGKAKYLYPSGGGAYAVQVYVAIKRDRVAGMAPGTYYYHPVYHHLLALTADAELDPGIYGRLVNRPVFEQAAFAVFLIVQLASIAPLYGERSIALATLEAGYMGQLMMMTAMDLNIGLCPIGNLDFGRIRHLFALDHGHVLLHSLLGGLIETPTVSLPTAPGWEEGEL
jgi:SagB-type dehydrogenase family enzyme